MLVRVKAASLCHSDLAFMTGSPITGDPLIMGYKGIRVVEELGRKAATYGFQFQLGNLIRALY
jgi:Zn-dependent alcohol dehydrogenase